MAGRRAGARAYPTMSEEEIAAWERAVQARVFNPPRGLCGDVSPEHRQYLCDACRRIYQRERRRGRAA